MGIVTDGMTVFLKSSYVDKDVWRALGKLGNHEIWWSRGCLGYEDPHLVSNEYREDVVI